MTKSKIVRGREEEGEKGGRRREGGQAKFSCTQAWGGGGGWGSYLSR